MGINRSSLTTADILDDNFDVIIEILPTRPEVGVYLDTAVTANKLCGFYDNTTNRVELYLTDGTGRRYSRVG